MSGKGNFLKFGLEPDADGSLVAQGLLYGRGGIDGPIGHGDVYYLVTNGNTASGLSGKKWTTAFGTLAEAEDAMSADQNDLLKVACGATSGLISETLTWDKNYTHVVGMGAPSHMAQRTRFFDDAAATVFGPLIDVTAQGCSFQNMYIFQGGTTTAAIIDVRVTGNRNFFNNIHFAGPGHATPAANSGSCALALAGAAECRFLDCTIGIDTIKRSSGAAGVLLVTGDVKRNLFEHCRFISWAETVGVGMVKFGTGTFDRFLEFDNCLFYNFWTNHVDKLTQCFEMSAGMTTNDVILRGNCLIVGIDEWDSGDRGNLWIGGGTPAAATGGVAVEPAV